MSEMVWRRAARCESNGCVEVSDDGNSVLLRSSLDPGVVLELTREEWEAFTAGLVSSEVDRLTAELERWREADGTFLGLARDYVHAEPGSDDVETAWYALKGAVEHWEAVDARRALGHTAPVEEKPAAGPTEVGHPFGIAELQERIAAGDWIGVTRDEAAQLAEALTFATGLLHQQLPLIHAARAAVREIRYMRGLSDTARALIAAVDELPSARLAHAAPTKGGKADHTPESTSDTASLETVGVAHTSAPDKPGPAETHTHVPLVADWEMPAQIVQLSCVGDPKQCGTEGCSMAKDGWNICEPADGSGEGQPERHGYTSHGHPCCPNASREAPAVIARCGGPALCGRCGSESALLHGSGEGQEARAIQRYEDARAAGLSECEAREEGWPTA